jgi:hypothetical protein
VGQWEWNGSKWVLVDDESSNADLWIYILGLPGLLITLPQLFWEWLTARRAGRRSKEQASEGDGTS